VVETAGTGIGERPQPRFILGGFVRPRSAMTRASSDNPKSSAVFSFCKVGTDCAANLSSCPHLSGTSVFDDKPLPFVFAY
jgi:hypothetical protein